MINTIPLINSSVKRHAVNQTTVEEYMRHRLVKAVIDMDFEKGKVRQAITRRFEDLGNY